MNANDSLPSVTNTLRATVLIVDDDAGNLGVRGGLLRSRYNVVAAHSGERALRIVARAPRPDLILLVVLMLDMDSYAVLDITRQPQA